MTHILKHVIAFSERYHFHVYVWIYSRCRIQHFTYRGNRITLSFIDNANEKSEKNIVYLVSQFANFLTHWSFPDQICLNNNKRGFCGQVTRHVNFLIALVLIVMLSVFRENGQKFSNSFPKPQLQ